MGMYDTIKCKYKLPHPQGVEELVLHCLASDFQGQTKDLDCSLDVFEISESGELFVERFEGVWVRSDPEAKSITQRIGFFHRTKTWLEPHSYTGDINFYHSIELDSLKNDYWIEYKSSFVNGKLTEIKLSNLEVTDNSERMSIKKAWDKFGELNIEFKKTLFYKLFYRFYLRGLHLLSRGLNKVGHFFYSFWFLEKNLDFVGQYFRNKSGLKSEQNKLGIK